MMIKFDESFYRRSVIPGGQAVVERSYPVGRKNFFRQSKTSLLSVRVCFDEQVTAPDKVCLHFENFAHNKSRVYTERLQGHSREFTCRVFPRFHGVTRFKIKYRLRRRWYWDNRPFSYFIVDPHRLRDIRMYTLIPNVSGHVGDWSQDLERIQALGFNTVHILPVTQMGISESPYAARDLFNLDTAFVNPSDAMPAEQQIESFVERACSLNMRLCFDLVFNNIGVDSLICRMKPEWLTEDPDEEDGIRRGGWDDGRQWHKWQDLAFINYDIPCSYTRDALWDHMRAYALYWSGLAARTNGMIRLDNLHSSHPLFIRWVLGEIRKAFPELIIFGELFDFEDRIEDMVLDYGLNFLLATPWEHKFVPQLRDYIKYLHRKHDKIRYLFPINSHDSLSLAQEFGDVRATLSRLAVSALMGPGPSGLTQGVEFGVVDKLKFIGRQGKVAIKGQQDYSGVVKSLNELVSSQDVLGVAGNLKFFDDFHNAILAASRSDAEGNPCLLIFINLDIHHEHHVRVSLAGLPIKEDSLSLLLGEGTWHLDDTNLFVSIRAGDFLVIGIDQRN